MNLHDGIDDGTHHDARFRAEIDDGARDGTRDATVEQNGVLDLHRPAQDDDCWTDGLAVRIDGLASRPNGLSTGQSDVCLDGNVKVVAYACSSG